MNLLFAPESVKERQSVFLNLCDILAPNGRLEMSQNLDEFSASLAQLNSPEIVVMLGIKKNDMPSIMSLFSLIHDAAILILLSEYDADTVKSAIGLRPKFIGTMERDLEKVVPIVRKLVRTHNVRVQKILSC